MQFHRRRLPPRRPRRVARRPGHRQPGDPLPDTVDVLIAGSGPAGLCLAAQLARVPQIRTMLVEPKLGPMEKGQADGISVRDGDVPGLRLCRQGEARIGVDQRDHVLGARRRGTAGARGPCAGRARRHLGDAARADQPGACARPVPGRHAQRAHASGARLRAEGGHAQGRPAGRRPPRHRDAGTHRARPRRPDRTPCGPTT
jgi:hypothetical protein